MSIKSYSILTKKYKLSLSTIHMVYRLVNSTYNLGELLQRLAKLVCQVLGSKYSRIILLDNTKKNIIFEAINSERKKNIVEKKHKFFNGCAAKIIRTGQSVLDDYCLGVPLVGEDILGAIILKRNHQAKRFDTFDQEILMAIAEQSVTAIRNLRLYEEQQKIILGSIKSIVTLLDKKVPWVYTHTRVFSSLVLDVAEQMHLSESEMRCIMYASLLHDTGKIDIPLEILTKTTKLTSREYGIIQSHPLKGAEIIKPLEILRPALPIILHHHEKYDGSGYPSGLKKGQIPIGARIMSVVDAFEAMVAGRPYRDTITIEEALAEIRKNSGSQFDPKVVDAFLGVVKKRKFKKYLRLIKKSFYNSSHGN